MNRPVTTTLGIAALFTLGAALGKYLELEPYQISIFWPPSGIALAAVLILGNRALPGIAIGAILTLAMAISREPNVPFIVIAGVGTITMIAWVLQPVVAAYLLVRQFQLPMAWGSIRAYIRGAIVIVACATIPASAGTAALYATGLMPISDIYSAWLIWWMGDVIGMITLTPALYISIGYLRGNNNLNSLPPARTALSLSISSILAILIFTFFYNFESAAIQEKVDKEVRIFSLKLQASYRRAAAEVSATHAYLASDERASGVSFTTFFDELHSLPNSLHCLMWAPVDRLSYSEGSEAFNGQSSEMSASNFTVKYIMPAAYSSAVGGTLDLGSQRAIGKILGSTDPNIARGVSAQLHNEEIHWGHEGGYTLTLAKAVYREGPNRTVTPPASELRGFIVAEYLLSDLVNDAYTKSADEIQIYVFADQVKNGPIWSSPSAKTEFDGVTSSKEFISALKKITGFIKQDTVKIADTNWTIVSSGGPEFVLHNRGWGPFFQAGTIMALGMLVIFMLRTRENTRLERERTIALRDAVVVSAQQPFIHLDQDGRVLEWNKAAEKTFGWSLEEVLGHKLSETLIPERYRDAHEKGMARYSRLGTGPVLGKPLEIEAVRSDNIEIPVSLLINSVKYENQWHYFAFVSDISEQKDNRLALNQAHDNLKRLYEAIPDAIVVYDTVGKLIECNTAAAQLFKTSRNQLLGSGFINIIAERSQESLPRITAALTDGAGNRWISERDELYCIDGDGSEFPVEAVVSPQQTSDGVNYIAVLRDNTEQYEAEQRRQQGLMIESLGRMTGILAHDFNNLLSIIIGHLDLVGEQIANEKETNVDGKYIDIALNAALRGSSMVKSLLSVAKQQPMIPLAFDVGQKIQECLPLIQSGVDDSITIVYEAPPEPLLVKADDSALTSALINLAVNATESIIGIGTIQISVEKHTIGRSDTQFSSVPGDYAVISVTDNGSGMSPDVLNRAAAPFFTTKKRSSASGLGLSMVSSFAKQHGGDISVISEVNSGTSVSVCIPLVGSEADEKAPLKALSQNRARVLVVDDQSEMVDLIVSWLESGGYEAHRAETPSLAIKLVSEVTLPFDLLITDVLMPATNGFQLSKAIQEKMPEVETLYITGTLSGHTETIFGDTDPTILEKPFRKDEMLSAVSNLLNQSSQETGSVVTRQIDEQ
ncbi:PAS domain S-box protein [Candidatus Marimicrobium litorale]|uniref:histidine kinase n=1 Tax=Candidatus Marimicrobium litorale TaxID=2518991 RepID=A0ABT3T8G0_9GAMM|nr:PAS domain S-box protein [Candidatus Marimicrobium litorale]MCX2978558.1 PAS domain S-box protein [Candidatus Marimicrobium litorale]